jgi:aminoglycoside phosphotransferase (APT) family kinase protein
VADWDAEVEVDEALARELVAARFPALGVSELRRVGEGWDNVVWATRDGIAFRFPRREIAVAGVRREIALLPELAPLLPLPIPDARYVGVPSERFRWPWFGSRLIAGREIAAAGLDDAARTALAPPLGDFLRVLHRLKLDAAAALPADPMGRTDMAVLVPKTRAALAALRPQLPGLSAAAALLDRAEPLGRARATSLVHGDLHVRHLLVDGAGALAGVIDWGDACRAHPSVDLSLYWSLLPGAGRDAFRAAYGPLDDDTLLRARVFALFSCALLATYARDRRMTALEAEATGGLQRALTG